MRIASRLILPMGLLAVAALAAPSWAQSPSCPGLEKAVEAVKKNLPNTPISSLRCAPVGGLYELVSGQNVVYLDPEAKFLVVGAIFDLKAGTDLTAPVISAAKGGTVVDQLKTGQPIGVVGAPARQAPDVAPETIDVKLLEALPSIRLGNAEAKQKLYVLGDPHCGFCQRLDRTLRNLGDQVQVIELPFNTIPTSRTGLVATMCATEKDRADMLKAMYDGEAVAGASCAEGEQALTKVADFARRQGWDGTPVVVRGDGAVMRGFAGPDKFRTFLGLGG